MKRFAVLVTIGCCCAGTALFAQSNGNHSLRINGFGGFGFGYTDITSGRRFDSTYEDFSRELGLDASGFLHDPRLANYSLSSYWDGNNSSIDQGSARSNGLSFSGGLNFLPERSFPFAIYFSRNRANTSGSLIPLYSSINTILGLRGQIKKPALGLISYNLGAGKMENDLPNGDFFNTRTRFANLTATRKLLGWDLRMSDDFLRTASTFSNFRDSSNTLGIDASRAYGDRVRMDFGAYHSSFEFKDLSGSNTSKSGVDIIEGSLTWKLTERLDSFFNFNLARNAVNTLGVLARANGTPGVSLPFNALTLNSMAENFAAGTNYRPTQNLALNANLTTSHNGFPEQTVATALSSVRNALTTDVLNLGGGYTYRRKVWNLDFNSGASASWQRFSLLSGRADSGVGYSLDNGVGGGDVRKVRFNASFRYSTNSNPFFFNVVTSSDRRIGLKLESEYLRFIELRGVADIGTTTLDLAGSHLNLDTSNYMASATLPRRRLTLSASRGLTNSAERFFGTDSILFQPGGSTGGIPLPPALLNPLVFSDVLSERISLVWRPRLNMGVESQWSRHRYLFTFRDAVENRYRQFDTLVHYKFGRFTVIVGYGRASGEAFLFNQDVNRFFLRVQFPFHVL